jgi:hypothetical protein
MPLENPAAPNTLPALVVEQLPLLVRAMRKLPQMGEGDDAEVLAEELAGITAMVAEKFTNDRTAEGIQRALLLTVGVVSLGLEQEAAQAASQDAAYDDLFADDEDEDEEDDEPEVALAPDAAALVWLIEHGAEQAFQTGFRLVRDLAALPEDSLVSEYDNDPVYSARRMKDLLVDLCSAEPTDNWTGWDRYRQELRQRKGVQAIVRAANWLRRHHSGGPVVDPDLNAEGVIAMAIIFAIEGGGQIVARAGQKEFERFVKAVRKNKPDFEAGWAQLLEKIPAQHQEVMRERIATYRDSCTVIQKIGTRAAMKTLLAEMENYAGSELDAEYP